MINTLDNLFDPKTLESITSNIKYRFSNFRNSDISQNGTNINFVTFWV